jgi:hypothetical protein
VFDLNEETSDLRKGQKNEQKGGKGNGYHPWELWSDTSGARLAPGLKTLRWPGAQLPFVLLLRLSL